MTALYGSAFPNHAVVGGLGPFMTALPVPFEHTRDIVVEGPLCGLTRLSHNMIREEFPRAASTVPQPIRPLPTKR